MLAPIHYLRPALDIPYEHHERWDGSGYPLGLAGEAFPLAGRIFAVADVWDALTSDRPYRAAWPEAKAREHIRGGAGSHFDPRVVEAFLELRAGVIECRPVGNWPCPPRVRATGSIGQSGPFGGHQRTPHDV